MTTTPNPWVSVARAAKLAGCTERTVWSLTSSGKWKSMRDGARRLVARESAEGYREKKTLKLQCQFQSEPAYAQVVNDVLTELKPMIEETVRRILEGR